MKRTFCIILAALMLLLCACSPNGDVSDTQSADSSVSDGEVSDETSVEESSEGTIDRTIDRSGSKILVSEGCSYTALGIPHSQYADDGTKLTDGVLGSDTGVGWSTSAGTFVLDLGEVKDGLADFNIFLRGGEWGIVAPTKAEYYVSNDRRSWELIGTVEGDGITVTPSYESWLEYSYPLELDESISARYVRFNVSGGGMNYAWAHEIAVWKYEPIENKVVHEFKGSESFSNLTMKNADDDDMGDQGAPGYCVYSIKGFNKAEMTWEMSQVDVNIVGNNGSRVTAYVFLGVNVYNEGGYWMNCCDAGFGYGNDTTGWRLFAATATDENGKRSWFDGGKTLDSSHDYKLTLDTSTKDGWAVLTAYDITIGKVADTMEFYLYGAKADGSNTSYLTDIAIDWTGEQTWIDENGNKTDDGDKVTIAQLGSGMHLKNVRIYDCALYKDDKSFIWTKELTRVRGIWSDADSIVKAETTKIHHCLEDKEYIVDLDLGTS